MRIFGREPAVWVALIGAAIALAVPVLGWDISSDQVALIMAAVTVVFGAITAYLVHDVTLAVVTGVAEALIAVAIGFGLTLSPDLTATIIALVTAGFGFFVRDRTSPDRGFTTA